jgi:hypothetical protein
VLQFVERSKREGDGFLSLPARQERIYGKIVKSSPAVRDI